MQRKMITSNLPTRRFANMAAMRQFSNQSASSVNQLVAGYLNPGSAMVVPPTDHELPYQPKSVVTTYEGFVPSDDTTLLFVRRNKRDPLQITELWAHRVGESSFHFFTHIPPTYDITNAYDQGFFVFGGMGVSQLTRSTSNATIGGSASALQVLSAIAPGTLTPDSLTSFEGTGDAMFNLPLDQALYTRDPPAFDEARSFNTDAVFSSNTWLVRRRSLDFPNIPDGNTVTLFDSQNDPTFMPQNAFGRFRVETWGVIEPALPRTFTGVCPCLLIRITRRGTNPLTFAEQLFVTTTRYAGQALDGLNGLATAPTYSGFAECGFQVSDTFNYDPDVVRIEILANSSVVLTGPNPDQFKIQVTWYDCADDRVVTPMNMLMIRGLSPGQRVNFQFNDFFGVRPNQAQSREMPAAYAVCSHDDLERFYALLYHPQSPLPSISVARSVSEALLYDTILVDREFEDQYRNWDWGDVGRKALSIGRKAAYYAGEMAPAAAALTGQPLLVGAAEALQYGTRRFANADELEDYRVSRDRFQNADDKHSEKESEEVFRLEGSTPLKAGRKHRGRRQARQCTTAAQAAGVDIGFDDTPTNAQPERFMNMGAPKEGLMYTCIAVGRDGSDHVDGIIGNLRTLGCEARALPIAGMRVGSIVTAAAIDQAAADRTDDDVRVGVWVACDADGNYSGMAEIFAIEVAEAMAPLRERFGLLFKKIEVVCESNAGQLVVPVHWETPAPYYAPFRRADHVGETPSRSEASVLVTDILPPVSKMPRTVLTERTRFKNMDGEEDLSEFDVALAVPMETAPVATPSTSGKLNLGDASAYLAMLRDRQPLVYRTIAGAYPNLLKNGSRQLFNSVDANITALGGSGQPTEFSVMRASAMNNAASAFRGINPAPLLGFWISRYYTVDTESATGATAYPVSLCVSWAPVAGASYRLVTTIGGARVYGDDKLREMPEEPSIYGMLPGLWSDVYVTTSSNFPAGGTSHYLALFAACHGAQPSFAYTGAIVNGRLTSVVAAPKIRAAISTSRPMLVVLTDANALALSESLSRQGVRYAKLGSVSTLVVAPQIVIASSATDMSSLPDLLVGLPYERKAVSDSELQSKVEMRELSRDIAAAVNVDLQPVPTELITSANEVVSRFAQYASMAEPATMALSVKISTIAAAASAPKFRTNLPRFEAQIKQLNDWVNSKQNPKTSKKKPSALASNPALAERARAAGGALDRLRAMRSRVAVDSLGTELEG